MVRLLLVLTTIAVLLYGCAQPNTPVQKQKKHGLEQAAPKPVTKVQGVTEPAVSKPAPAPQPTTSSTNASGGDMSGEQAALAEAYCRMVT
jgi:PBP1b-binding outer membrane lipoprotein LpoB